MITLEHTNLFVELCDGLASGLLVIFNLGWVEEPLLLLLTQECGVDLFLVVGEHFLDFLKDLALVFLELAAYFFHHECAVTFHVFLSGPMDTILLEESSSSTMLW